MNEFYMWFSTGLEHILDINGYDHILYIMVLCLGYNYKQWKKLLLLITAFTIGHSFTLAFSVFHIIVVKQHIVEIFIPLTIIITAIIKGYNAYTNTISKHSIQYLLALSFGFIHGMGFSYLLKSLLSKNDTILFPLFAFNFGLEIGQIIVIGTMLLFSVFLFSFTKLKQKHWQLFVSTFVFIVASHILINRFI